MWLILKKILHKIQVSHLAMWCWQPFLRRTLGLAVLSLVTQCSFSPPDSHHYSGEAKPGSYLLAVHLPVSKYALPLGGHSSPRGDLGLEAFAGLPDSLLSALLEHHASLVAVLPSSHGHSLGLTEVDFSSLSPKRAANLLRQWRAQGWIDFWEPNWWNELHTNPSYPSSSATNMGNAWWQKAINLNPALGLMSTIPAPDKVPVVAVLDSGVDDKHPALVDAVWSPDPQFSSQCGADTRGCNTAAGGKDRLGNGEAYPYGTRQSGQRCGQHESGVCLHATHIAGLIAGRAQGGIKGICPFCKIANVRVVEDAGGSGKVSDASILRGLKYISQFHDGGKNRIRLVNLSFGKYRRGRSLALFLDYLRHLRDGVFIVGAAGNEDSQTRIFPAAHASVFAVSALAASGRKASYSNFGSWVQMAAPGGEVIEGFQFAINSSVPGGSMGPSQGTSMAAPLVTGTAALMLAHAPHLSVDDLRDKLIESADRSLYSEVTADGYNGAHYRPHIDGVDYPLLGAGRLDVQRALIAADDD
jgi:subtilisin family serine protease